MTARIGFMQGRLSPLVGGRIQAFPWDHWEQEFPLAQLADIRLMEWTLDQERLYENPLLTEKGRGRINELRVMHGVGIPSLTGDCFMQAPFWKVNGPEQRSLQQDFHAIVKACGHVGITMVVVPLVDNGRLDTLAQEDILVDFLLGHAQQFRDLGVRIIFESDFAPAELTRFIGRLPGDEFGINYDIGNSAALGYRPAEEFAAYGHRVVNVHVKDRKLGGTTVPLGTGDADFNAVFRELARVQYEGLFILQTARAMDEKHLETLGRYRDMTRSWMADVGMNG